MTPTPKAPAIDNLLTNIAGISRQDAANQKICTFCRHPVDPTEFRSGMDVQEYRISGLCQRCQDIVFHED